tara:strand:- start:113 stop:484 length:372 start_codon:yes stop_codon:yes gene_type:complete
MRFWGIFNKGQPSDQSGKEFKQDTDDGLLYFHTHGLFEVLSAVEKFYECEIYGLLCLEDTVENLRHYIEFEECGDNPSFICSIDDVPKSLIIEAHKYAYNKVEYQDYEAMLDCVNEYIVNRLR